MSKYSISKLDKVSISTDIYTVNDISANLSSVNYLDSNEVGQEEIVDTINAILSAFKCGGNK